MSHLLVSLVAMERDFSRWADQVLGGLLSLLVEL
jgi:hypothetical protein